MTHIYVIGEGGRPTYALYTDDSDISDLAGDSGGVDVLRGGRALDAVERLEAAGQAIADACEHILGKVREGLAGAAPTELELTFSVGFAGEAGVPVLAKATAEAGIEVRALWSKSEN